MAGAVSDLNKNSNLGFDLYEFLSFKYILYELYLIFCRHFPNKEEGLRSLEAETCTNKIYVGNGEFSLD